MICYQTKLPINTALNVVHKQVSHVCLCVAVSSQERQPSEQPSVSGPHPWLVSVQLFTSQLTTHQHYCILIIKAIIQVLSPPHFYPSHRHVYPLSLFCCLSLQNEKWMNVRVGDIIKLENNQFVAVSVAPAH